MLEDVLADTLLELTDGHAFELELLLEVLARQLAALDGRPELVLDLGIAHRDAVFLDFLFHELVLDHGVEKLRADLGDGGLVLVGQGVALELLEKGFEIGIEFEQRDDLAVDHGDDAIHNLARHGGGGDGGQGRDKHCGTDKRQQFRSPWLYWPAARPGPRVHRSSAVSYRLCACIATADAGGRSPPEPGLAYKFTDSPYWADVALPAPASGSCA